MGNLVEIKKDLLINVLTSELAGVYLDSHVKGTAAAKVKALVLRQLGYVFFAQGTAGKNFGFVKSVTSAGQPKIALYALNDVAPTDPNKYEEYVKIDPGYKNPGVDKALYYNAVSYGGNYVVTVSGSTIVQASMRAIIDDMCEQNYSDPTTEYVKLGMGFVISGYTAGNNVVINGTPYDAASLAALITAINAGTVAYAYAIDATSYAIVLRSAYSATLTTESTTISDAYLGIIGLTADVKFDTMFMNPLSGNTVNIQAHTFPYLTSDEVTAILRNRHNHGVLSLIAGSEMPVPGVSYAKYHIFATSLAYNNQTPGGNLDHVQSINLYVPASQVSLDYWKAGTDGAYNDISPASPDKNFDEILAYWIA